MTAIANDGELDDDTYDGVRHAIRHRADPDQMRKLELIDRLVSKNVSLTAFVREWDRLEVEAAGSASAETPAGLAASLGGAALRGPNDIDPPIATPSEKGRTSLRRASGLLAQPRLLVAAGLVGAALVISAITYFISAITYFDRGSSVDPSPAAPILNSPLPAKSPGGAQAAAAAAPTWLFRDWTYNGDCGAPMEIAGDARTLRISFNNNETSYRIDSVGSGFVQTGAARYTQVGEVVRVTSNASPPLEPYRLVEQSRCRN